MNPTMSLKEVVDTMRSAGFRTSETAVADSLDSGRYPFGTLVRTGKSGRRTFEIYRVDFECWLSQKTGGASRDAE